MANGGGPRREAAHTTRGLARSGKGWPAALALAVVVLILDQFSKWAALQSWSGLPRSLFGVRLEVAYNPGISFSQLSDAGPIVIGLVAAVAVAVVIALVFVAPRYRPPLGVVLGGALGNLVDRLRYDGTVLDFIGILIWPSFNVADVAIVGGTLWLVVVMLRGLRA